ncbi:MAG: DNA-binding response regulator [Actinobacteria bacterium]|nr:DNA-binding response regulator [Actinomycetota bacterium]
MVSIAVCEQQEMVREALVKAIAPLKGVTVLVAENDGESFVKAVQQHKPQVMVVDVAHANGAGLDVARRAKAVHGAGKVVTLVDDESDAALVNSYELGASAVVSKRRPVRDLHQAVLDVASNVNTINPVAVRNAKRRLEETGHMALSRIDATDRKMLELLTKGYTDRQIASEVYLSLQTVRNRMSRLLQKFHLENRTQLALHIERLRLFGESVVAPELTSAVAG